MSFQDLFNKIKPPPYKEELPPSLLSITRCNVGSWAEIEIIDNTRYGYIKAKVIDSDGFNVPSGGIVALCTDRLLFRAQHPFDRHAMTTIGARMTVAVERGHKHLGIPRYVLRELCYGIEKWDRGFKW